MKRILSVIMAFTVCALLFAGCAGNLVEQTQAPDGAASGQPDEATAIPTLALSAEDISFSDRDGDAGYDAASATIIALSGAQGEITGEGAAFDGGNLTLSAGGTYVLSGSFTGTLVVDAPEDAKLQLVLAGVEIAASSGPALLIRAADKVFITLAQGTKNTLADAVSYALSEEDENADGTIFSRADLTINGAGALAVTGNYKHGIVSKDDLVVKGGDISVKCASTALAGKDCIKIAGGAFTLDAGGAGVKSENEEEGAGFVYIEGGTFSINAGGKGMMGYAALEITGGTFDINSADDALHTNGSMTVTGGNIVLSSGDDGMHADADLNITGGTISILESYEGIEGANIFISGGDIALVASDDGLNAAGGADSSGFGGGFGGFGGDKFSAGAGDYQIVISGGYLRINASGDGIDSNGTLAITGGVTLVSGPTNSGNGALDAMSGATVTGGVLIAAGASGMAEGFDANGSTQCSALINGVSAAGGTRVTLCDQDGNVLVSFVPEKDYASVVISAPSMAEGETYTLYTGGTVAGTDANGYASSGTLEGGSSAASVEQSSLSVTYGGAGGFNQGGGGNFNPGGNQGGGRPGGGGGPGGN